MEEKVVWQRAVGQDGVREGEGRQGDEGVIRARRRR